MTGLRITNSILQHMLCMGLKYAKLLCTYETVVTTNAFFSAHFLCRFSEMRKRLYKQENFCETKILQFQAIKNEKKHSERETGDLKNNFQYFKPTFVMSAVCTLEWFIRFNVLYIRG